MRRPVAALVSILLVLGVTGCIIGAPPSRYWIENNSDSVIVLRKPVSNGYTRVTKVAAHEKAEVARDMATGGCVRNWEIVDEAGRQLRAIDKICDGDTIVFP